MATSANRSNETHKPDKLCFVTIGATAPFDSLLLAVLSPAFYEALNAACYTDLLIQHGKEGTKVFEEAVSSDRAEGRQSYGLRIAGFDFNKGGLGQEMRRAKGDAKLGTVEGVVISHAGIACDVDG